MKESMSRNKMQCFETVIGLPEVAKDSVVVIGNFDGVHKGHQRLLQTASDIAQDLGKKLAVLTFEPHPRELFRPDEPPCRITPLQLKAERLELSGVDILFSIPFNWEVASMSAQDFIDSILKQALDAAHIVVGYDFHFGQMRKGTSQTLLDAGLPVTTVSEIKLEDRQELSSSKIRHLLRHGDILEANRLLGWNWEIQGKIIHGDKRGRLLGFPTANMSLGNAVHPAYGVYAAKVRINEEKEWKNAAVNIGIKPMFEIKNAQIETYVFDFNSNIYEQNMRVRPIRHIRGEAKFSSVEELVMQMEKDCIEIKKILGNYDF